MNAGWTGGSSLLAEIGTIQVEFRYLAEITGRKDFREKADKVFQIMNTKRGPDGLYPIYINPNNGNFDNNKITFGAMGDSFYEYMLKCWLQGGKKEVSKVGLGGGLEGSDNKNSSDERSELRKGLESWVRVISLVAEGGRVVWKHKRVYFLLIVIALSVLRFAPRSPSPSTHRFAPSSYRITTGRCTTPQWSEYTPS